LNRFEILSRFQQIDKSNQCFQPVNFTNNYKKLSERLIMIELIKMEVMLKYLSSVYLCVELNNYLFYLDKF